MKKLIEDFLKSKTIRLAILICALIGVGLYADGHVKQDIDMMRRVVFLEEGLLKQVKYIHDLEIQSSHLNQEINKLRKYEEKANSSDAIALNIISSAVHARVLWEMIKSPKKMTTHSCIAVQKKLNSLQKVLSGFYKNKKFNQAEREYLYKVISLEKQYFLKLCSR